MDASSGSDSHSSVVYDSKSSITGVNDAGATEALLRLAPIAEQENIVWTKIKGHPYWPTQHVRMTPEIEKQERFQKARRFRRKIDNTCVMYFGTCEVAFVNEGKSCIPWGEGLQRNMHLSQRNRSFFQRALKEVQDYCHRNTTYPRGWWCEPECIELYHRFADIYSTEHPNKKVKHFIKRADKELVFWAKVRGFPYWPVQILPRSMAREQYPQLKMPPENPTSPTNKLPCIFFGTGEVAMLPEKNLTPFGAGVARDYPVHSSRSDFMVAVGEIWGYLQEPRVWPSGYLSGAEWWNYEKTSQAESTSEAVAIVPHLPKYTPLKKSVWAVGVEPPPKPKKSEISCCECTSNGKESCCADAQCLNFASHYFCNVAACKGGEKCTNLAFHKRGSPRMKPFLTADQRGWGLRVEEHVKAGSFVIEYVGEIIDRDILEDRLERIQQEKSNEYYFMDLANDLLVDAKFKGNLSRFINSSCEPNCQTEKWYDSCTRQTHVGIFAIQDITPGTELTYNYCFEDYGLSGKRQKRSFMCQCGTSSCNMLEPIERKLMKKLVNKRLEVRWDDGWYPGVVELYNFKKKKFRVQYDDGDCEDLVLGLPLQEDDGVAFRLVEDKMSDELEQAK
ncbi:unnamed protein product [Chondrus crispus]|uniref:Uncharacterized protein n=1 Tax=Chondrus crispus TaxID=2769 RepID=R7QQA5_CHOCR|nr:unnamed protein product [Chondrus crispus]CDF40304.1 unnamed protein product [Chondrus crispus]|eukprot:XP_005710598.1 unnamed protein product [Chondrus crispus]